MLQALKKNSFALGACLALAAPTYGVNADSGEMDAMKTELQELRKDLAELRALHLGGLSDDERKKFLDAQIAKVYAEAQAVAAERPGSQLLAGIDEKGKIFLKSADNAFTANFNGQVQFRYIFNNQDSRADESQSGFQVRRVKFGAKGKIGDGWGYEIKFATQRAISDSNELSAGDLFTEDAYISYKIDDSLTMKAGVKKLPFARQELISSSRQVGVDRGLATEFFTLGRSELIELTYKPTGDIILTGAISDGANQNFSEYNADNNNDFAVTGRVDWMAIGDSWSAAKHEFGGVEEDALFIGAAAHYEQADGANAGTDPESGFAWTADALYKTGSLGLTAAIFGNHVSNNTINDTDQLGGYLQASLDLDKDWDVFGRWEYIDDDDQGGNSKSPLQAFTVGVNKHISKNVKFTADVVYAYAGDNPRIDGNTGTDGEDSSGLGLSGGFNDNEDTIALRLQLQLLF